MQVQSIKRSSIELHLFVLYLLELPVNWLARHCSELFKVFTDHVLVHPKSETYVQQYIL